jgi:hypothetical protein
MSRENRFQSSVAMRESLSTVAALYERRKHREVYMTCDVQCAICKVAAQRIFGGQRPPLQ